MSFIITCRHLCNPAMFFTHNTQYSLLLLIHVQVQCDLAITRTIYVNVCSLNYLNLFLKYKIGQTCCVCVCVFVFGIMCFFWLRDNFESSKCCLDHWLSCMFDCIHICIFLFLKTYRAHLLFSSQSRHLSIVRWINQEISCLLDSSSIH